MPPWALLRVEWVQRKANLSLLNKGCCDSMHANWRKLWLQKHVRACIYSKWGQLWCNPPPSKKKKKFEMQGDPAVVLI